MKFLSGLLLLGLLAQPLYAQESRPQTADEALSQLHSSVLKTLIDGNQRFREQNMRVCAEGSKKNLREQLAKGQKPYAIILSCSDSRVPPELIFDQSPGDIFVIRVAGNTFDPIILGSIEYAAEHLGTPLIMVLGHERCGAVTATVKSGGHGEGNIGSIVDAIAPAVDIAKNKSVNLSEAELVESSIDENVHLVARKLFEKSPIVRHLVEAKKVKIVEAKYDLDDGKVSYFTEQKFEYKKPQEPVHQEEKVEKTEKAPEKKKIIIRKKVTEVKEEESAPASETHEAPKAH